MAPGGRKLKMKSIPDKSLQSIINHTTKDASCNSTPRRSIRQLLDKTNVANNGMTEALVTSGLHNGSSGRGETNTTNNTNENGNMQQNSEVPPSQSPEIQSHSENTQEPAHEANDISGVRKCMIERLKSSTRQKRYKLHQHFKKYATLEEAKNNKPSSISNKQNWEVLCEYFATPEYKDRSVINTGNRKQVRAPHISGRTPFTVLQHEISQKELNGEECDMIELYKRIHYKEKNGWSRIEPQENWELMISKRAQYTEEGIEKSVDEIVLEVLGHGSGNIKGFGYGPKPPSRRTTSYDSSTRQLQNKLQETQEKLQKSESQVSGLKSQVGDLKDQLSQQGACIEKLMAFMAASGNNL